MPAPWQQYSAFGYMALAMKQNEEVQKKIFEKEKAKKRTKTSKAANKQHKNSHSSVSVRGEEGRKERRW